MEIKIRSFTGKLKNNQYSLANRGFAVHEKLIKMTSEISHQSQNPELKMKKNVLVDNKANVKCYGHMQVIRTPGFCHWLHADFHYWCFVPKETHYS